MIRKILGALIAFLMLLPVGGLIRYDIKDIGQEESSTVINDITQDFSNKMPEPNWSDWNGHSQVGLYIHTNYNGIEKDTPVLQSIFNGIDVDNNLSTGEDGNDIRISVFVFPYVEHIEGNLVLLISFTLRAIRLEDKIKNGEFELSFGGTISYSIQHTFRIGFYSAESEEIPRETSMSVTIVPYLFYDKDPEFYITVDPFFDTRNQNMSVILEYFTLDTHKLMIDYFPVIHTMMKFSPSRGLNKFNCSIEKFSETEHTIRARYEGERKVNLIVEDIPQKMEFTLSFSEKYFEYEASAEFNASLAVESYDFEICIELEHLPSHLLFKIERERHFYVYVERYTEAHQKVKMRYKEMAVNLTIVDIPQIMEFSLYFSKEEKYFEYEASAEFNSSLIIEIFGYPYLMKIEYLPRSLRTQFNETNYFYIYVDKRSTNFTIADSLEEPDNYVSVTNLTGEAIIRWRKKANGYLTIDGLRGLKVELKSEVRHISFKVCSVLEAEHFDITWNLSVPGYVFIDTNGEWLSYYSFNFTLNSLFGLLIEVDLLKADDFTVEWETEFPFFNREGELQYVGNLTFAIMLNGTWYYVF
jgi:hypothetical protein